MNERKSVKDGGKLISVDMALTILTAIIAAAGAFFATRASLEGRVASLEAEMRVFRPLEGYSRKMLFFKQIQDLRILDDALESLESYVNSWTTPQFQYARGRPAGVPSNYQYPPDYEFIERRTDSNGVMPQTINAEQFNFVILSSQSYVGYRDKEIMLILMKVQAAVGRFNNSLIDANSFSPPPMQFVPGVGRTQPVLVAGARRADVEKFVVEGGRAVEELRTLLRGLRSRLADARREIEEVISQSEKVKT